MHKSGWLPMMQGLSYLTQVGLSFATPVVLMLLLASWLTRRVGVGAWVYVPALILGLGAGVCSFAGFARYVTRKSAARTQRQPGEPGPVYVPKMDSLPVQKNAEWQDGQDKVQEKKH